MVTNEKPTKQKRPRESGNFPGAALFHTTQNKEGKRPRHYTPGPGKSQMKRKEWEEMTLEEKLSYLEECTKKRYERFIKERDPELVAVINKKIEMGYRLTMEEFESYTGVKFSWDMGGKMKDIISLSTCCLLNPLCRKRLQEHIGVCAECFAEQTLLSYQGLLENLCYNYKVLSEKVLPDELIPYIDAAEFRGESFGDAGTETHAFNMIKFALFNPHCAVSIWTKNPWLYDMAFSRLGITVCPENLTIIYSSQYLNRESKIPEKFAWFIKKTFTVYTAEYLLSHGLTASFINCGGRSCKTCQRCYKNAARSEKSIHELLKKDTHKLEKSGWKWEDAENAPKVPEKPAKVDYSHLFI